MFKNVASQKLTVFAFDSTTNLPKSGDAANITAYRSLDDGTVTVLGDTSATEMDSTNAKGYYVFDLTQAETNGDKILFSGKSSTSNIVVVAVPAVVYTVPANFSTLGINSSGHLSRVTLVDTLTTYTGDTPQTGDSFARIGAAGAGLTAIGDTRIANLDAAVSSRMATYTQPTGFLTATFPTTVASTTNITAGTITTVGTVTTLTNLPAITANWLTGTGVDATAVTKIQLGLATSVQIPANFTAALFASAGVFSVGALANAPTGGSAPTAADIRAEIDSNSTQLAAIVAAVDSVPAAVRVELTTELGRIDAAITTRATPAEVNEEVLDVLGIQTLIDGKTIVESHQIIAAMAGGVVSGAGTGTETFLGLDGLTDRVVVTVDEDGNRTEVTYP